MEEGESLGTRLVKFSSLAPSSVPPPQSLIHPHTHTPIPHMHAPTPTHTHTHARTHTHTHTHTHTQKINEKPQVVNDYESGKAIPNQQVISKLERAVGVKLRGKDMGSPLGPKKK